MRVIGLMSGTSLDGIDAALIEFGDGDGVGADGGVAAGAGEDSAPAWRLVAFESRPYGPERRDRIQQAILRGGAASLARLHTDLGEWFAAAALGVCRKGGLDAEDVDLIGSHGQTIWHEPRRGGRRCATLQLGCPATIAERSGIPVVSDFRARDAAAGGEGAPLVAWADRLLYALPERRRALQNIGGMANVTWLPPRGSEEAPLAFDTGPGVALINAVVSMATNGRATFDEDGERAARGRVDAALLAEMLDHPFFDAAPPKSTGRETFGTPMVEDVVERRAPSSGPEWDDLAATATALTAQSIEDAYRRWVLPRGLDEVVLTGGGAKNPVLRRMLAERLEGVDVRLGGDVGIDVDAREAVAFAALGRAFVAGEPGNVPEATGAAGPRVLGSFTPGVTIRERTSSGYPPLARECSGGDLPRPAQPGGVGGTPIRLSNVRDCTLNRSHLDP